MNDPQDRPTVRIIAADPTPGRRALEREVLAQLRARRPDLAWSIVDEQPAPAAKAA